MAYYALLKLHILPSVFLALEGQEKAFVVASIEIKAEDDRKKEKEAQRSAGKGKRRKRR